MSHVLLIIPLRFRVLGSFKFNENIENKNINRKNLNLLSLFLVLLLDQQLCLWAFYAHLYRYHSRTYRSPDIVRKLVQAPGKEIFGLVFSCSEWVQVPSYRHGFAYSSLVYPS